MEPALIFSDPQKFFIGQQYKKIIRNRLNPNHLRKNLLNLREIVSVRMGIVENR